MTSAETNSSPNAGKGNAFFERADQVAETGNWDFAIEMYLEGISREPENLDRGHKPLRKVSINRKAQGGKPAGMIDQFKRRPVKDPVRNLVNAEYMLSKDPGSVQNMMQVLHTANKCDLTGVAHWISLILLESQRQSKKPNKRILVELINAFEAAKDFSMSVQACDMAMQADPNDGELRDRMRSLSALYTIDKGKFEEEGDFTKGVDNLEAQQKIQKKDSLVKDEEYLIEQIKRCRQDYLDNPHVAGKINNMVDALLKIENESYENEAIDILAKAHKDSGAYQFKMRIGDIRIRQMSRRFRQLRDAGDTAEATEQARRQLAFELDEYKERCANYPTDLSLQFEMGRRQFLSSQYDEAIASLQVAQRDPRRSMRARSLIGQAFVKKGWLSMAAETFEKALDSESTEEFTKELRYFLGDAREQMGQFDLALEQFSTVAQLDYNYRDVRHRIENIRKRPDEPPKTGDAK
jgi:tetratricopeptide (TPR) repeat protein